MNNKLFLATTTLALLLLTGCGQTIPDLPGSSNNISDASALTGDTVSIDETNYDSEKSNSSSDGFQSVYFDFGDYGISSGMANSIARNVSVGSKSASKIKIEGNCDEFGTDEYNYALGLKRAKAVKDAMTARGVSSSKVVIVSYGESNPVCSSPTDSCYGKNRRVDLRLIK
jgi:peptidoglycan-associated lipoprotein